MEVNINSYIYLDLAGKNDIDINSSIIVDDIGINSGLGVGV